MKLIRNTTPAGRGKYRLWRYGSGKSGGEWEPDQDEGGENEFFALKLKDKHAAHALDAYASSIATSDPEFSAEVQRLAEKSRNHPSRKQPD